LQLKDANYRKKEIKLQRDQTYLKRQLNKAKLDIEKQEEHREQDAEALLDQENKLSKLKGRYRNVENPNEVNKIKQK
jgi:hypothetical protein